MKPGRSAAALAATLPVRSVSRRFDHAIHGLAVKLDASAAATLARNESVQSVEPDHRVDADDVEGSAPWGLDRIDQRSLPLSGTYTYDPNGGSGVTAYVIDTGIRATHTDFGGRVLAGANFVQGSSGTDDCDGHGTHVAGIIGGSTYGVAKAVSLVPVRVLDCGGSGLDSWVIAGIDWVIANHPAGVPAVANLSLGGPPDQPLNDAIASLVADKVVVSVAAGNSGGDACQFSPSSAGPALTVGASDAADAMAGFSNSGSCVDVFAPGVDIPSDWNASDSAIQTLSGTSMAAPHVAGIAAVLFGRYPSTTPGTIAQAILGDATNGAITGIPAGPNKLAHLANPVPGAQQVYVDLPPLYTGDAGVVVHAISTSGQPVTFTSLSASVCSVSGSSVKALAVGTCVLRATVAGGAGWSSASADRATRVYHYHQTIAVAPVWAEFAAGSANATGATTSSGLPVNLTSYSPSCTISGSKVIAALVGDCSLVATQPGNIDYGPAAPVLFSRSVHPATQTLTAPSGLRIPVGSALPYAATSSRGLPVVVSSATLATCTANGASVGGGAPGSCGARLTQDGSATVRPTGSTSLRAVGPGAGYITRLTTFSDGRAAVAYTSTSALHLLICADVTCSSSVDRVIDDVTIRYPGSPNALVAMGVPLVIGGRVVLPYIERAPRPKVGIPDDYDQILRIATCADATCTTWTDSVLVDPDPTHDISISTLSAAVSAAGEPLIAYWDGAYGLRLLVCSTDDCSASTSRDIATSFPADFGQANSIAVGPDGLPVLGYLRYQQDANGNTAPWETTVLARCLDTSCSATTKTVVGTALYPFTPAIVVPADNRPVMFWMDNNEPLDASLYGGRINYRVMGARCDLAACATATTRVIDASPVLLPDGTSAGYSARGFDVSAALGPDGLPRVSYLGWTRLEPTQNVPIWAVVVAACSDAACSTVRRGYVDEWGRFNGWVSWITMAPISIAPTGLLTVAFGTGSAMYRSTNPMDVGLKVATCALAVCGTEESQTVGAYNRLSITKSGTDSGSVVSNPGGIRCGTVCADGFSGGTVTLTATPSTGAKFTGWSGSGCSGTGTCTVAMSAARAVTASFADVSGPKTATPTTSVRMAISYSGLLPIEVDWSATDVGGSGVAHYQLARSVNGGSWVTLASSTTGRRYFGNLSPSGTARFRVRAVDKAGNYGAWAYSPTLSPRLAQENSSLIAYHGSWGRFYGSSYSASYEEESASAGSTASITFTGRSVGLLTTDGVGRGSVDIYVDGLYITTLSAWSNFTRYRYMLWTWSWASSGTHTIKLVVWGTYGHPKLDLDAFALLR